MKRKNIVKLNNTWFNITAEHKGTYIEFWFNFKMNRYRIVLKDPTSINDAITNLIQATKLQGHDTKITDEIAMHMRADAQLCLSYV